MTKIKQKKSKCIGNASSFVSGTIDSLRVTKKGVIYLITDKQLKK